MKKKRKTDSALAEAAAALEQELEELELLTRRAGKLDLASRAEILRAADLLKQSLETHGRFVAYLTELTKGVGAIRERQNAAVEILQSVSTTLEERRNTYAELEERFGHLGETAQDINTMIRAGGDEDTEATKKRVSAAIVRLSAAADEARVLAVDARLSGFTELEQQATATHQQLESLVEKLQQAVT